MNAEVAGSPRRTFETRTQLTDSPATQTARPATPNDPLWNSRISSASISGSSLQRTVMLIAGVRRRSEYGLGIRALGEIRPKCFHATGQRALVADLTGHSVSADSLETENATTGMVVERKWICRIDERYKTPQLECQDFRLEKSACEMTSPMQLLFLFDMT